MTEGYLTPTPFVMSLVIDVLAGRYRSTVGSFMLCWFTEKFIFAKLILSVCMKFRKMLCTFLFNFVRIFRILAFFHNSFISITLVMHFRCTLLPSNSLLLEFFLFDFFSTAIYKFSNCSKSYFTNVRVFQFQNDFRAHCRSIIQQCALAHVTQISPPKLSTIFPTNTFYLFSPTIPRATN